MAHWVPRQIRYAHVDQPSLIISGETFMGGLDIVCQPTYGRILFRQHGVVIQNCAFYGQA